MHYCMAIKDVVSVKESVIYVCSSLYPVAMRLLYRFIQATLRLVLLAVTNFSVYAD